MFTVRYTPFISGQGSLAIMIGAFFRARDLLLGFPLAMSLRENS